MRSERYCLGGSGVPNAVVSTIPLKTSTWRALHELAAATLLLPVPGPVLPGLSVLVVLTVESDHVEPHTLLAPGGHRPPAPSPPLLPVPHGIEAMLIASPIAARDVHDGPENPMPP